MMFQKAVEKIQVQLTFDQNNSTEHDDLCTLLTECSIGIRMGNVSDKICNE
jgi:hypothetical protein